MRCLSQYAAYLAPALLVLLAAASPLAQAQRLEIPRRHDKPPGPPLSAAEAAAKMTVPAGFRVEVVAAEPDVVNPVAMCIDDRGRFWITESFEYPRREPGAGRDRIKVLEDTDGDGRVDKTTIFADGLNIPSGIAVGYGGVWVANAPDLLFLQDTDGDLRADRTERVLTGFGRTDTHELPNAFTWGPDGWLYGLNGVFNYCQVRYPPENPNYTPEHEGWDFTCALWRLHPRTRQFELFAEGTSNPWGIAINHHGDFFLSACVIDHLWHIAETGYYIRQGGPYPPHTWPMPSIVDYKHQKAAYCGITYFDSDAYPAEYRDVLYMGNIHGGCLNADLIHPRGASYVGEPREDFLTANDAWFMPVAQKTGPDGSLYVLDWYDRYHCYQDANADPEGVDRGKGRLYRVRYRDTPRAAPFDLAAETDDQLIARLHSPNVFYRDAAQRILSQRADASTARKLIALVDDARLPLKTRMHAMWACGSMGPLPAETLQRWMTDGDQPSLRAWAVRFAGNQGCQPPGLAEAVTAVARTESDPRVQLQAIVAIQKAQQLTAAQQVRVVGDALRRAGSDPTVAHIGWNALRALSRTATPETVDVAISAAAGSRDSGTPAAVIARHLLNQLCDDPSQNMSQIARLGDQLLQRSDVSTQTKTELLRTLLARTREKTFDTQQRRMLGDALGAQLAGLRDQPDQSLAGAATLLAAMWHDSAAQQQVLGIVSDSSRDTATRIEALQTLVASESQQVLPAAQQIIASPDVPKALRVGVIESLGALNDPRVGDILLAALDAMEADVQPKTIEILTQRPAWTASLLRQIQSQQLSKDLLNLNQLQRIASFENAAVVDLVNQIFGTIRTDRRSDRQHVIHLTRDLLNKTPGDPVAGQKVFKTVCAQCHKMYDEGAEVGPDITRNGRNDWNQLLQNVLDPSAVIGPGYQARTVVTDDGRVLTGLPTEESPQRIVLKIQGGKLETIPRDSVEVYKVNEVSLMPEELEKQLKPQELADLFAYLALDRPPSDPRARLLPGAPAQTAPAAGPSSSQ